MDARGIDRIHACTIPDSSQVIWGLIPVRFQYCTSMSTCDWRIEADSRTAFMILILPCSSVQILCTTLAVEPQRALDGRIGGKLLLMDGKAHGIGAKLESCVRIEAPWRMQVRI